MLYLAGVLAYLMPKCVKMYLSSYMCTMSRRSVMCFQINRRRGQSAAKKACFGLSRGALEPEYTRYLILFDTAFADIFHTLTLR